MNPRDKCNSGFTLIELLTAVAIMALLTTILMPSLLHAREAGRSAKCQSNLRQWGLALASYMVQNNGVIPRRGQGIQWITLVTRPEDWFNCLPPYLNESPYQELAARQCKPKAGENSLFICPSATDPGGACFFPYAMNMYLSPWIRPQPHRLTEVADPSRLVFMADAPGRHSSTVPSSKPYSVVARHNGRANLVFLDGHCESRDGKQIGCGSGDTHLPDVLWQTDSGGVNQDPIP